MEYIGIDWLMLWKLSPGYMRLYVLFLFVLAIVVLARSVRIGSRIRRIAKSGKTHPDLGFELSSCLDRILGMRRLVSYTLFLTLMVAIWLLRDFLLYWPHRLPPEADVAGGFSCMFPHFSIGLFLCAAILGLANILEEFLTRRSVQADYEHALEQFHERVA